MTQTTYEERIQQVVADTLKETHPQVYMRVLESLVEKLIERVEDLGGSVDDLIN